MPGLGSIGSIVSAGSSLIGPFLGGIGGSSRQKQSVQNSARTLVLNQSNPFFTSRFDPKTQALSLSASPQVQALIDRSQNFSLPRVSPVVDFNDFAAEAGRLSGSTDEIIGDLAQIEETLKNKLGPLLGENVDLSNLTSQQLQDLLGLVEPGFGRLTETVDEAFELARTRLDDNRRRASGDLKESLSRRRILGSSFATDAQTRQDAEFERAFNELANQQAQSRAQNFLQEIDLSRQLIQQNFDNTFQSIQQRIGTVMGEFQARLSRVQTELGARFLETKARLSAFGQANQQALAFGQNDQAAALAEQQQANAAFEQFQALGDAAVEISSGIQSAFSELQRSANALLAEAARGRGAAFGTALDKFGELDIFGEGGSSSSSPLTFGSGFDTFSSTPGFVPRFGGTAGITAF